VCRPSVGYRRDRLEAALLEKFHAAMAPPMVETLTRVVNTHVEAATQH